MGSSPQASPQYVNRRVNVIGETTWFAGGSLCSTPGTR